MLLRLCGKYLHLMQALEPIASNVFVSMSQLIDFYVLAVFEFFSRDQVSEYNLRKGSGRWQTDKSLLESISSVF